MTFFGFFSQVCDRLLMAIPSPDPPPSFPATSRGERRGLEPRSLRATCGGSTIYFEKQRLQRDSFCPPAQAATYFFSLGLPKDLPGSTLRHLSPRRMQVVGRDALLTIAFVVVAGDAVVAAAVVAVVATLRAAAAVSFAGADRRL